MPLIFKRRGIPPLATTDAPVYDATVLKGLGRAFHLQRRESDAVQHTPLIRAPGLAHYRQRLIDDGAYRTLTEIAAGKGRDRGQVSRIAQRARLAPDVVEARANEPTKGLTLENVLSRGVAAGWGKQQDKFALAVFSCALEWFRRTVRYGEAENKFALRRPDAASRPIDHGRLSRSPAFAL